ncbi:MAG: histidine phosphatase family protein [Verrucomicrobiota bacterium]
MTQDIYLIRHGETDCNLNGVLQGRGVNAPLNENGRQQARAFFEAYRSIPFDRVYTSTLIRTHQTVQGFVEAGISHEQHPGLDELSWGVFEGQFITDENRAAFKAILSRWKSGDVDASTEQGESPQHVLNRLETFIQSFLENERDEPVLWCSHGRTMRILLSHLLHGNLNHMDQFSHENTSLYRLQRRGNTFTLLEADNTDHLQP